MGSSSLLSLFHTGQFSLAAPVRHSLSCLQYSNCCTQALPSPLDTERWASSFTQRACQNLDDSRAQVNMPLKLTERITECQSLRTMYKSWFGF